MDIRVIYVIPSIHLLYYMLCISVPFYTQRYHASIPLFGITFKTLKIMLQPTKEHLHPLNFVEKHTFALANWCNVHLKNYFIQWNALFMYTLIWFGLSRRLTVKGLENVADVTPSSSVLLASNHRTFFDFFVITWINFDRSNLPRRILFPVRANFFYTNYIGFCLNFVMGGCAMFPPIFREHEKKGFNTYAIDRIADELEQGGVTIGMHPEGTRNKSSDPYSVLPAKPGIGHVLTKTTKATVIPIFIIGMSNRYIKEVWKNWFAPKRYPIVVYYGKKVEFTDTDPHTMSDIIVEKIRDLAETHRNSQDIEGKNGKL